MGAKVMQDVGLFVSHEHRLEALEKERGAVAADISSLRTELRVEVKNIKDQLNRIEDKLDERPSRSEIVETTRSRGPRLEIDGKRMWMKVSGAFPIIISLIGITLALLAWLTRR
jgi:hypothetical protein